MNVNLLETAATLEDVDRIIVHEIVAALGGEIFTGRDDRRQPVISIIPPAGFVFSNLFDAYRDRHAGADGSIDFPDFAAAAVAFKELELAEILTEIE